MAGFDTAATIVSDVALELGLVSAAISDPWAVTVTDANIIQLRTLLKPTGRELARLHPWTHLQREHTFNTANGTASYALPSDFGRFVTGTAWNRTQSLPVPGSITPQQWQREKAAASTGVYKVLRVQSDLVYLHPTPSAIEAIYLEYISRNWGAASFAKEAPTAAADVVQFEPNLFSRELKRRFLAAKGFDTTDATADVQSAFALAVGQDGMAPKLSLGGAVGERFLVDGNLPETGFGS